MQNHLEKAAKIIKALRLAGQPGMDGVALQLAASGVTHQEYLDAKIWEKVLELAKKDGDIFHLALDLSAYMRA